MTRKERKQKQTANYTPGPWVAVPYQPTHGADIAIDAKGYLIAKIPHDSEIQDSADPDYYDVVWHPSDKPNAALIAAAPELLEALKDLYGWTVKMNLAEFSASAVTRAALARAAAAIDTATNVAALDPKNEWGKMHGE
jgi:hypothetical protein